MQETLIARHEIAGRPADVGSDWHIEGADKLPSLVDHLRKHRTSEVLFLMGDLFDAQDGEDTSGPINELVQAIAPGYSHVIVTPGNHDLRGRVNPWDSFVLPENVHAPHDNARVIDIHGTRILLADLFYDMQFIDPTTVGLTWQEVEEQYRASNDGKHLLGGQTASFERMRREAAALLQPDVQVLATHSLPHPSLVTFRVPELTPEVERQARESGLRFVCNPEEDAREAVRYDSTPEGYRRWWNIKSIFMGSNVLEDPTAHPRDGLWAVHGHHHRIDLEPRSVRGNRINIVTHQPNPWKWRTPL
jgi:UDP-2,3-diacylglucosamine pyrophosphatase LpxH